MRNLGAESLQAKINLIAATLELIQPDVVALQEVLTDNAAGTPLAAIAARLQYQVAVGTADSRGNRVAFLLRAAPAAQPEIINAWSLPAGVQVQDQGANAVVQVPQLPRPALAVRVAHNGRQITLVNCHLKSKLLTFPAAVSRRRTKRCAHPRLTLPFSAVLPRQRRCARSPTRGSARTAT